MFRKPAMVVSVAAIALLLIGAISLAQPQNHRAHLAGDAETPAVNTLAQREAIFQLNTDSTELSFKLIVANIENVRAAHIHSAPAGVAGPVVVGLYLGPTIPGRFQGTLAERTITAATLTGPLAGQSLADLLDLIDAGNAYVKAHTDQYPGGQVRGRIF